MKQEPTSSSNANVDFLLGGGEMGARMRSHDWSKTSLGSVHQWPQSLKTAVRIMLTSRQAMFVWWGDELINLYNDAYKAIVGGKHPEALGQPASYVWREIWDQVGPRAKSAMLENEGTYDEALLLIMERYGYPEETYYTFSYSPVPTDQGGTGGIICANTDDTQRIIGERQLTLLRELAHRTADARTFDEACTRSASCLETNPYDLPFAMIYLVEPDQQCVFLAGACGIGRGHAAAPEMISLKSDSVWPFAEAIDTHKTCLVSDLAARFGSLPTGAWERQPYQAVAVPIAPSGQTGKAGILVVGLNPFRLFDDNYRGFINLVSAQIAASIANAQAYEEERKRAEALAELDRAKTVFFSNVSHEFRTPLTLMLGPLEETLTNCSSLLPPNEREQLEMVQRNGLRLLKLVNTLLDFSRIEAGRVQASYEPTDLATFTAELASVFRSTIKQAGMQLLVNCPALPAPVYVDREMWEKIVLNLLSNAFKFTFAGEIAVSLQWANDHVELAVRDTGTGIPAEEIPHLFERFHRVQGAQGRTFEGSGIGLSLVQELVRMHGGTVQVTSVLGEGSCFTVSIPTGSAHLPQDRISAARTLASTALGANPYLEEALRWLPPEESRGRREAGGEEIIHKDFPNVHSSPASPAPSAPSASPASPAPSAYILLADDNADMRDYVKRLLSQQYEVEAVSDGLAALSCAHQRIPDLVLTDVMMPELDGFGLLQELRANPQTREVPIILLSARAGEEARVEGLEAGADDYLIKPFSARELLARVEANLKLARLRQETTRREQRLRAVSEAAQRAAETAKVRLESVLAGINDQFIVLDREWRYTFINDQVVEVTGKQKQELLGKSIWDVFPDLVGSSFDTQLHRAVAEQTVVRVELFYPPLQRWFENRIYPFADGVTIFVTDISGVYDELRLRKRAEAALHESEERLRLAIESTDLGTWDLNPITGVISWDDRCKAMFGLSPEAEVNYDVFLAGLHPDDRDRIKQAVEWALNPASDGKYECEYRTVGIEDGVERWLAAKGQAFFDPGGEAVRFVGTILNITDRKQVENALLESEERFRNMADNAPVMIWVTDPTGYCTYLSKSWYDFTGQTEETGLGLGWVNAVHPEDQEYSRTVFLAANEHGEGFRLEYRLQRKDGEYRSCIDAASPWFGVDGQFKGYIGSVLDISERKAAEAERDRLLQLEQAARAEAETANRIKDEFLAVLSHELRSPLNPILGWAKLLQGRRLDEQATQRALETIERNAKLQTQLIEDLLDVSRILRGKMVLNVSPVNLVTVIQAALETVRLAGEAKRIEIQTMFAYDVKQVSGDSARLQQIVWNLLSNAIKFTPQGGRVQVRLEQVGTHAQIQVQDTGRGITREFLPHVFEYFRQEDGTTTRKFGGLGLGLAIVRHLTELHGGTVRADSPGEGLGATFTVTIPLVATASELPQDTNSDTSAIDLAGLRVLVVDDEADMRYLVEFILEQHGAEVNAVASALEALTVLQQFNPDVLISDIGMPIMDGYMLMRQVRAQSPEQGGRIPAIALSAYAGELDQKQSLAAGFGRHVAKPVEPDELVKAIATLIE